VLYLVIVNYYSSHLIDRLLKSLPKQTIIPYHVLIIDNSEANIDNSEANSDITNLQRYTTSKMTIIKS
jgi:GT2 family glycosyltransferase